MAFPTTPVLDSFNAGALQNVSARAGWSSARALGFGDFVTDAVPTKAVSSGLGDNIWGTAPGGDAEAYIVIADFSGSGSMQACARWGSAATTVRGYRVSYFAGAWNLQRWDSGAPASTIASGSITLGAGDSLGIECIGTTIAAYSKIGAGAWTPLGSGTDATYASGNIAMTTDNAGNNVDAFGGGSPIVAPTLRELALCGVGA